MNKFPPRGLYAITLPDAGPTATLETAVARALTGGAVMIQYRDKSDDPGRRREQAESLVTLCRAHDVPLIINDDVELARRVGAGGVHIGRDDASLQSARDALGADAIVGVSCYNSTEHAVRAERAGADYVAFGRFFPSSIKPAAVQAPLGLLEQARSTVNIPIVAIGGITPDNGASLLAAGADLLAVINGVFGTPDPETAARAYAALFD